MNLAATYVMYIFDLNSRHTNSTLQLCKVKRIQLLCAIVIRFPYKFPQFEILIKEVDHVSIFHLSRCHCYIFLIQFMSLVTSVFSFQK